MLTFSQLGFILQQIQGHYACIQNTYHLLSLISEWNFNLFFILF